MTVVTVAYPQPSFLRFEKNAITPPNYAQSLRFPSRFQRTLSDVTRKRRIIVKIAAVRANSGVVIEKEQEFKPSFEEYLKAMDTVKSRREKRKASTETPPLPKIKKETVELSDSQEQISVGKLGNSGKGEIKKTLYRNKLNPKERSVLKSLDEFQDVSDQPRVLLNSKQDEVVKKWTRKKSDSKEAQIDTNAYQKNEETYPKFEGQSFNTSRSYVKNKSVNSDRVFKHENFDRMEIERAAFKPLEKFQDVCDQPRVSRVDMEDRIQKLAKCLNGAPIDSPEWNFSKMMRSAKIRFADFSIIRLIQILGNYGNWRQVLQVIEWMQSRERFKSNGIRNIYTAALDALGKARRPVEALNVFYTMQQQMSSYPDIVAYRCIAVTL